MSIFFEILVRIASYGPQIEQSRGENRLSQKIKSVMTLMDYSQFPFFRKIVEIERSPSLAAIWQLDSNVTERAGVGVPKLSPAL